MKEKYEFIVRIERSSPDTIHIIPPIHIIRSLPPGTYKVTMEPTSMGEILDHLPDVLEE